MILLVGWCVVNVHDARIDDDGDIEDLGWDQVGANVDPDDVGDDAHVLGGGYACDVDDGVDESVGGLVDGHAGDDEDDDEGVIGDSVGVLGDDHVVDAGEAEDVDNVVDDLVGPDVVGADGVDDDGVGKKFDELVDDHVVGGDGV